MEATFIRTSAAGSWIKRWREKGSVRKCIQEKKKMNLEGSNNRRVKVFLIIRAAEYVEDGVPS
jgi:hypothetical protein